jgi:putative transposase
MTQYRRKRVPGATYFFTVNVLDRRGRLLVERVDDLRAAVAPFRVDAWVVLPEHLHCIWTLPEGDGDFSRRWRLIKGGFSARVPKARYRSASRGAKGERGIWRRRFWQHTIRDARDNAAHRDYVHFNPVKHGLVVRAADWPYSSFQRAARMGLYPADWGEGDEAPGVFGERCGWGCVECPFKG